MHQPQNASNVNLYQTACGQSERLVYAGDFDVSGFILVITDDPAAATRSYMHGTLERQLLRVARHHPTMSMVVRGVLSDLHVQPDPSDEMNGILAKTASIIDMIVTLTVDHPVIRRGVRIIMEQGRQ